MALRNQVMKDGSDVPSGSRQTNENSQEDEALDDNDELSSSLLPPSLLREKRKRDRENKSKPKEMTEEEMVDLALRLSEQEASITALRLQKEEEAMMKAIQDSMVSQTQPCPSSQSQSLLSGEAEASLRIFSRRKLLYSNGSPTSAVDQRASEDTTETDLNRGAQRSADESNNWNKKRKRKEGSPLMEMPDLSQSQKIYSQASPCGSDTVDLVLDSPQSCDSTQIDDCQFPKSPVFPSTGRRAEVHVPRLSQDLLQTCRTSGFVLCSQDSGTSPLKPSLSQPRSPTFPKCPSHLTASNAFPKSSVFSETDQGDNEETQLSPEYLKSPVFGRNTQHEKPPSSGTPHVSVCNSGFTLSSQESLTSSVRSESCRPKSPVFPGNTDLPKNLPPSERSATSKSPVFSETEQGQTEQSHGHRTSPVFNRTGRQQKIHLNDSESPSAAEFRGSASEESSTKTRGSFKRPREDSETDHNQDVRLNESSQPADAEEEPMEISKDRDSQMELTSDMKLLWSDEDDDVTVTENTNNIRGSELLMTLTGIKVSSLFGWSHNTHYRRTDEHHFAYLTYIGHVVQRVSFQLKDLNSLSECFTSLRPSSSSTSTSQQQLPTAEQEPRPVSSQGADSSVSAPPGESAGRQMVHYYWGVPFCPRGLDPDKYTQVILAQMEVYEKSLKQAQRCLLRKAEWGEAILPQLEKSPSPESPAESPAESPQEIFVRRRGIRLRGKKLCDSADSPPADTEEEEDGKGEEERRSKEEETKNEGEEGEGQVETDDCEVCPETQLSDNDSVRTQDLTVDNADAEAQLQPKSPELPEVEVILPVREEEEEVEVEVDVDVDAPVERKMKANIPVGSSDFEQQSAREEEVEEDRDDPDVEEIKDRELQRSNSPELEPAVVPQSPEPSMDCPICQGSFPVTEIEMHAAYCNGEVTVVDERRPDSFRMSLKPHRKRTRRAAAAAEETNKPSNTTNNQEKCFICQKEVPLSDYSRHTELCIQRQSAKAAGSRNLLSALEKTESRDSADTFSTNKHQQNYRKWKPLIPVWTDVFCFNNHVFMLHVFRDVIDLRDDDDDEEEEGGVSAIRISNSPIRSFTPISEATDCLIDFKKQQQAKKPRQRRR
ncbi:BRCA1-A complex subunit RAP80 [Nibea albiflora]|uniref:BRCA1-A complex subunit RAP80 n=1 Tax=Nibea albiflora TaxID=240163 RepID=A0ACB7F2E5_NIBAL|nr:BRCA1-A complex subunit RAP80 [Nibea albiflora]